MDELGLLTLADARSRGHTEGHGCRRVFPSDEAIVALRAFDELLPWRRLKG